MDALFVSGASQLALTAYFTVTHWVDLPPFNDLRDEDQPRNLLFQVPMAVLAAGTLLHWRWVLPVAAVYYTLWMAGHLLSWWVPYLTGWPRAVVAGNTQRAYAFLPQIRERPTPDLLHSILGVLSIVVLVSTFAALR
jgi:hypothetical protein